MTTEPTTRALPAGYIEQAAMTAIYSPQWAVIYPALGLGNEAGELAEKALGAGAEDRPAVLAELGDVLWYVAALARDARVEEHELAWAAPGADMGAAGHVRDIVAAAGAAQGHVKKALRDHDGDLDARRAGLIVELARLLRAADGMARHLGSTLDAVAQDNLDKLAARAGRGTLSGDGDVR